MTPPALDVLAFGNAIVDVLSYEDDAFLDAHGLTKGSMQLVEAGQAAAIYGAMGPGVEASGGSAANTAAGVASLGGSAGFVGKVRDDQLGGVFTHDIRAIGVEFVTPPATDGAPTAQSLIIITPDAQRTMNTFLGSATDLTPADVDPAQVARASIVFLEGYLWDPPAAKDAFRRAVELAKADGAEVALTLSDAFCVERYRDEFLALIEESVDILFANEDEVTSLYEVSDFDVAAERARSACSVVALTRGAEGSVVMARNETHVVRAHELGPVVDTTGAGDQYAAGFLFGLARAKPLAICGQLGSLAAAEVIGHYGPRPLTPLKQLASAAGLA